ncbi:concanavalin A-like lectin/glucanase domain-containing protein [Crepidotus variabilis]|uniref:Concanavalin A-like lectin/glucanase domain-containing protein n=1 Tax=Crepidotus variabilis TaxID=179855 RepID=A0A9P6E7Z8_9AGAR|nr:concanavalin A-like lectin/glucanase domain-containing protein [Crepidotus variabilis]
MMFSLPSTFLTILFTTLIIIAEDATATVAGARSIHPIQHTLVRRAVRNLHRHAADQTHSLAKDLRMAFGGILPRANDPNADSGHHVYCKMGRKQTPFSTPPSSDGNSTTTAVGGAASTTKKGGPKTTTTKGGSAPTATNAPTSSWKLTESHAGSSFFDGWNFFTGGDPTNGIVDYIDEGTARGNGLLEVNSAGNAVMRVETTPVVTGTRKSVRISSKTSFNGGLFIMDSVHMPSGCGSWPAFWTNGPHWPFNGEIDIIEGVHDYTNNQATIHTDVGCTLASKSPTSLAISGSLVAGTNCAANETGNQGCGIRAATSNSFGAGFNSAGGGVYAMKWDSTGIAIYFFPRNSIPDDINNEAPNPDSWGLPQARWPATTCDPFKFFVDHVAIFDTTLCGDWASGVWNAAGIPGQEQSCAQRTGVSTCEAFVRGNGNSFQDAYWEVKYVKMFAQK